MNRPFAASSRLAGPEGDGLGPYLNEQGAFLGLGTSLLESETDAIGQHRWRPRPRAELERVLGVGYGRPVDLESRMGALRVVANALSAGEMPRAAIALLHARLPPLPDIGAARRMAEADPLAKYSPLQPRVPKGEHGGGQWTMGEPAAASTPRPNETTDDRVNPPKSQVAGVRDEGGTPSSYLTAVAYSGEYHDQVVDHFADIFRSQNIPVETKVPLTTLDGRYTAIADLMIRNPETGEVYVLEVKTGDDPTYTRNQSVVYAMASVGGHVYSDSPKIATFGFTPGALLPPIEVDQVYAIPGQEIEVTPLPPEFQKFAKFLLTSPSFFGPTREDSP